MRTDAREAEHWYCRRCEIVFKVPGARDGISCPVCTEFAMRYDDLALQESIEQEQKGCWIVVGVNVASGIKVLKCSACNEYIRVSEQADGRDYPVCDNCLRPMHRHLVSADSVQVNTEAGKFTTAELAWIGGRMAESAQKAAQSMQAVNEVLEKINASIYGKRAER